MTLRRAPLGRDLTVHAPGRARRGVSVEPARHASGGREHCPFCPTQNVMRLQHQRSVAGHSAWTQPNAFPIADHHELLIASDDHDGHLHTLDLPQLDMVTDLLAERAAAAWEVAAHVAVWHQYGVQAGASQEHPHIQIATFPEVPAGVLDEAERLGDECALCVSQTIATAGGLKVAAVDSVFEGELVITPVQHGAPLRGPDHGLTLGAVLRTLQTVYRRSAYNVVWHAFCPDGRGLPHEHVHVMPRSGTFGAACVIERWADVSTSATELAELVRPTLTECIATLRP